MRDLDPFFLTIPPYLSAPWKHIASLRTQSSSTLIVELKSGVEVTIPSLTPEEIRTIFEGHQRFGKESPPPSFEHFMTVKWPPKESFTSSIDLLSSPNTEIKALDQFLEQIKTLFPWVEPKETHQEKGECRCLQCHLSQFFSPKKEALDPPVTEEDLSFRDWEVKQTAEHLYQVTNPLDAKEQYSVFLGSPVGCTCGKDKCEHIRAALKS